LILSRQVPWPSAFVFDGAKVWWGKWFIRMETFISVCYPFGSVWKRFQTAFEGGLDFVHSWVGGVIWTMEVLALINQQ
jgi:hypothetical protein